MGQTNPHVWNIYLHLAEIYGKLVGKSTIHMERESGNPYGAQNNHNNWALSKVTKDPLWMFEKNISVLPWKIVDSKDHTEIEKYPWDGRFVYLHVAIRFNQM